MLSMKFISLTALICTAISPVTQVFYASDKATDKQGTTDSTKTYTALLFNKTTDIACPKETKSVLFNSNKSKLYALNLEGGCIYEFDQATKQLTREFTFKATPAKGWDYKLQASIPSFAEKPVEGCFSNDDKILWVSLHNAGGIVPIILDSSLNRPDHISTPKTVYVYHGKNHQTDTLKLPLIKTGRTPKIIAKTADNSHLLVSNWHSNTISILKLDSNAAPYAKVISNIPVSAWPRGIAVDNKNQKSYATMMGDNHISVINHKTWKIEKNIKVLFSPRHIVMDSSGHLFVSFNHFSRLACIDSRTGQTLFKTATHGEPRTIVLSRNSKFIFVSCYIGNTLDIYKVNKNSFTRIYSIPCPGKPIGIDLFEDDHILEAWVSSYSENTLKVFTFTKQN